MNPALSWHKKPINKMESLYLLSKGYCGINCKKKKKITSAKMLVTIWPESVCFLVRSWCSSRRTCCPPQCWPLHATIPTYQARGTRWCNYKHKCSGVTNDFLVVFEAYTQEEFFSGIVNAIRSPSLGQAETQGWSYWCFFSSHMVKLTF